MQFRERCEAKDKAALEKKQEIISIAIREVKIVRLENAELNLKLLMKS